MWTKAYGESDRSKKQCVATWEEDVRIYRKLRNKNGLSGSEVTHLKRHPLKLVTNEQHMMATDEVGCRLPLHEDHEKLIKKKLSGGFTTDIVEEAVGMAQEKAMEGALAVSGVEAGGLVEEMAESVATAE